MSDEGGFGQLLDSGLLQTASKSDRSVDHLYSGEIAAVEQGKS